MNNLPVALGVAGLCGLVGGLIGGLVGFAIGFQMAQPIIDVLSKVGAIIIAVLLVLGVLCVIFLLINRANGNRGRRRY